MKVRIFSALTMQEAMSKVKATLGRDAIILHTRKFRKGGIGGFLGREMVEVMAAADTPIPEPELKKYPAKNENYELNDFDSIGENINNTVSNEFFSEETHEDAISKEVVAKTNNVISLNQHALNKNANKEEFKATREKVHIENEDMKKEMIGMKQMLEQLLVQTNGTSSNPLFNYLLQKEFLPEYANKVINELPDYLLQADINSKETQQALNEEIQKNIRYTDGIDILDFACKKVALIGSTGVGKTTTLAKLAARFSLECNLSVAFITSDTYRIAAVEQLKTYANILNIPLEVVYSSEEMKEAIEKHSDKHLVLIDTAGRNQYNSEQLNELEELLKIDSEIETHLVLSCTTKYQDAVDVINRFAHCSSGNIIFTKIDEANNIGNIFNLMCRFPDLSISYVTNGQNVPDDIQVASTSNLTEILLRD